MKFTFWAVIAPFLLFVPVYLVRQDHTLARWGNLLGLVCTFWLLFGFGATFVYWLIRFVRFAWRDGGNTRPQEQSSGKIFGQL